MVIGGSAAHGRARRGSRPSKGAEPPRKRRQGPRGTRRTENAETTRRALLREARRLFARHGYAAVSLDEICRRARVTKGALYHHFRDKRDLFRMVCREVEAEWVARTVAAAAEQQDPLGRLELGCEALLDACLDPTLQRVLLLDAPAVLDWDELREIETRRGLGLMSVALGDAMDSGQLERQPVKPLARLILGALTEASVEIARDANPARARAQIGSSLTRLIRGLRPETPPPAEA
jgi:AcrR family transcriptional regulator